ncbi:MAG: hypothetical protein M3Q08_14610 [Pseudomonadota bacterium]|nr:hypothetical protein [Pseudomonadota bacterium]
MRRTLPALMLVLATCGTEAPQPEEKEPVELPVPSGPPGAQQVQASPPPTAGSADAPRWESAASAAGTALRLVAADGGLLMSVDCRRGPVRLVVEVPSFVPVASEERFSFGLGAERALLAAHPARQKQGVSAEGMVPSKAAWDKAETVSATYGTQRIGPIPAPPEKLRDMLSRACG